MFFAVRDTINIVKWSPRQNLLGAAGGGGQFLLYDPVRQTRIRIFGSKGEHDAFNILSCSWFPSRTKKLVVLGGTSGCAEIWDVNSGMLLRSYLEHSPEVKFLPPNSSPNRRSLYSVSWSPDRAYIASAGDDFLVRVWRAATGETCYVASTDPLRAGHLLAWLPDNKTLVSSTGDEVFVWDAFSGLVVQRIQTPLNYDTHGCRAISPDGTKVAVATGKVVIYDLTTGSSTMTYPRPTDDQARTIDPYNENNASLIAWSPDGKRIATSFHEQPEQIYVWDVLTGKTVFQRTSHEIVSCLDWSCDSMMLAWGGQGYLETLTIPS